MVRKSLWTNINMQYVLLPFLKQQMFDVVDRESAPTLAKHNEMTTKCVNHVLLMIIELVLRFKRCFE